MKRKNSGTSPKATSREISRGVLRLARLDSSGDLRLALLESCSLWLAPDFGRNLRLALLEACSLRLTSELSRDLSVWDSSHALESQSGSDDEFR